MLIKQTNVRQKQNKTKTQINQPTKKKKSTTETSLLFLPSCLSITSSFLTVALGVAVSKWLHLQMFIV